MELKLGVVVLLFSTIGGSNRTFMELKSASRHGSRSHRAPF